MSGSKKGEQKSSGPAEQSLQAVLRDHVVRFGTRVPDWDAFADTRSRGYKRAQLRYVGSGASGKRDLNTIPPLNFTLSLMYVPVGEGNAPHTHDEEEIFFVLKGHLTVFVEDSEGRRLEESLGQRDCFSCPPNVVHGYRNDSLQPVYLQVMLGHPHPALMGYQDPQLQKIQEDHLKRPVVPRSGSRTRSNVSSRNRR